MNDLSTGEDRLRAEIGRSEAPTGAAEETGGPQPRQAHRPGYKGQLLVVLLMVVALAAAGYHYGYQPRQAREAGLLAESQAGALNLPVVNVAPVSRSDKTASLMLPGNIQAVTEAPVLARASGYIRKRMVDIGDRVTAGQVLAEIEAPELDQQIKQVQASVDQADAAVQQAEANLDQGRANETLAQATAKRFDPLFKKGVISRQDNETYQAQWAAQQAAVQALQKGVGAAQSNGAAARANLDQSAPSCRVISRFARPLPEW